MVVYSDSSVDQVATVCYMYYLSVTWETMLTYISIVTYTKYVDTKLQLYYTAHGKDWRCRKKVQR